MNRRIVPVGHLLRLAVPPLQLLVCLDEQHPRIGLGINGRSPREIHTLGRESAAGFCVR